MCWLVVVCVVVGNTLIEANCWAGGIDAIFAIPGAPKTTAMRNLYSRPWINFQFLGTPVRQFVRTNSYLAERLLLLGELELLKYTNTYEKSRGKMYVTL